VREWFIGGADDRAIAAKGRRIGYIWDALQKNSMGRIATVARDQAISTMTHNPQTYAQSSSSVRWEVMVLSKFQISIRFTAD
jgi:hypothetical protein